MSLHRWSLLHGKLHISGYMYIIYVSRDWFPIWSYRLTFWLCLYMVKLKYEVTLEL